MGSFLWHTRVRPLARQKTLLHTRNIFAKRLLQKRTRSHYRRA